MDRQIIYNHLHDAHGLILLESEIDEIINVVDEAKKGYEVTAEWLTDKGFYQDPEEPSYRWFYDAGNFMYDLDDFAIAYKRCWEFPKKQYCHDLENFIHAVTGKKL
jgi:hypothetical protein